MYSPQGKKDGIQLIQVGEVAAKDEFTGIKTASRDEILAAHRAPPQLLGIVPGSTSGFGDAVKAARVFVANELVPLQARFRAINDWAGEELVPSKTMRSASQQLQRSPRRTPATRTMSMPSRPSPGGFVVPCASASAYALARVRHSVTTL